MSITSSIEQVFGIAKAISFSHLTTDMECRHGHIGRKRIPPIMHELRGGLNENEKTA